ncbi:carbonic anhydrase 6-like [Mya arenaria]|uniref:carbonic anhydrase 6-like n=1 Tax=Mya arenaria TaxID=6604 RepID=UPI0022E4BD5F|nr:carbonic anhydrase 6-like [Mya arenaria]
MRVTLLVFVGVLVHFRPVSSHMRAPVAQGPRFSYDSDPRNPIGHTVEFKPQSPQSLRVTGVPSRSGEYILDNIHLHYGPVSSGRFNNGRRNMLASSEHTLAGRNFDGELHVELYNWLYGSLEEAEKWADGVVVLAFFVQTVEYVDVICHVSERVNEVSKSTPPLAFIIVGDICASSNHTTYVFLKTEM